MGRRIHHVIGGGTVFHVRPHLALCAPAYGKLARSIASLLSEREENDDAQTKLHLTKMADASRSSNLETNEDVAALLDEIVADPNSKIVFLTAALVDFEGVVGDAVGKAAPRLKTREGEEMMRLIPREKILGRVRRDRKDIFLVACKTTAGASADEQYLAGLRLLKQSSANLVLANDLHTRLSMVVTPEQARYHESTNRQEVVAGLVEMALARSRGHFTRSTIVPGSPVAWESELVPASLRAVVNHCIKRGAYKPFLGSTVGHFAVRLDAKGEATGERFLTSRRKTNFNQLSSPGEGLVLIESKGDDEVIAHGSRPSVGGQSQRIVFREHPDLDCIVHFHCPLKPGVELATRSQWQHECGSHECGANTSRGLTNVAPPPVRGDDPSPASQIKAVMLDQHGPNIVFSRSTNPQDVIDFIERTFDLEGRTDGVPRELSESWSS